MFHHIMIESEETNSVVFVSVVFVGAPNITLHVFRRVLNVRFDHFSSDTESLCSSSNTFL